jgi:hypothetical protein
MYTLDGVPLLYNGMEVGDNTESAAPRCSRRPIDWGMAERRPQVLPTTERCRSCARAPRASRVVRCVAEMTMNARPELRRAWAGRNARGDGQPVVAPYAGSSGRPGQVPGHHARMAQSAFRLQENPLRRRGNCRPWRSRRGNSGFQPGETREYVCMTLPRHGR